MARRLRNRGAGRTRVLSVNVLSVFSHIQGQLEATGSLEQAAYSGLLLPQKRTRGMLVGNRWRGIAPHAGYIEPPNAATPRLEWLLKRRCRKLRQRRIGVAKARASLASALRHRAWSAPGRCAR
jgi:hypothetical protein